MWDNNYMVTGVNEYEPSNSTYSPEYPTTTTNKVGHYLYFNSQGDASTDFLNCSNYLGGTAGGGGFKFHQASSTLSPIKLAEITTSGIKIDKSTSGAPILVNLPIVISGQPTQVVFNYPPGLDTFGIQFEVYNNPVQVLFNSGPFVVGTTYYAQASNDQTLIIRATSNPSDPPLNCSSFTYGQLAFAYVSGSSPSVVISENLSATDLILIKSTANSDLKATDLTFNETANEWKSQLTNYELSLQDNSQGLSTTITPSQVVCDDSGTTTGTMRTSKIDFIDTVDSISSVYGLSDITYNDVSLRNQIIQPVINQLCSPAIFGSSPSLPPQKMFVSTESTNIINLGVDGWQFRNFSTGINIDWKMPFASTTSTVGDLYQLSFCFISATTTSTPHISVYTLPATSPNFYNSRRVYTYNGSLTIGVPYIFYINFNGYTGFPFRTGHTPILLASSPISSVGNFDTSEVLYPYWSVGSNSAAAVNLDEFIVSQSNFLMMYNTVPINQSFSFSNSGVLTSPNYITQASGTLVITPYNYSQIITTTGTPITLNSTLLRAKDAGFYFLMANSNTTNCNVTYTGVGGSSTIILNARSSAVPAITVSFLWTGTYFIAV